MTMVKVSTLFVLYAFPVLIALVGWLYGRCVRRQARRAREAR
jgi:hypothetical protein